MRKILKIILSKIFLFGLAALLQIFVLIFLVILFSQKASYIYIILTLISGLVAIGLVQNDKINYAYRNIWLFLIIALPVTGFVLYVIWGKHNSKPNLKKLRQIDTDTSVMSLGFSEDIKTIKNNYYKIAFYLEKFVKAPLFSNSKLVYFKTGEDYFESFLSELQKAKKTIFMEYFIISKGTLWNKISAILYQKAKEGLDIRIIYDGLGSLFTFDKRTYKKLKSVGVKFSVFNPVKISISMSQYRVINFRDHRKICIIDSETAYSGGVNIADEYANIVEKYGYWKDGGYMVKGPGAVSFTSIFLKNWQYISKQKDDIKKYIPASRYESSDTLIQTYWDSPLDYDDTNENLISNLIYNANKTIFITTPYLILDNTLISALTTASQSGIDIKIIAPGIPDKKSINIITKSYYKILLDSGIEIYEYTPGFIHSKNYIFDDCVTLISTANLDYRSLFLNYENGSVIYDKEFNHTVKKDFFETVSVSKKITYTDINQTTLLQKILQKILRIFAPLV